MNEFTFYNQGNLAEYREKFINEFNGYNPEGQTAYQGYIDSDGCVVCDKIMVDNMA